MKRGPDWLQEAEALWQACVTSKKQAKCCSCVRVYKYIFGFVMPPNSSHHYLFRCGRNRNKQGKSERENNNKGDEDDETNTSTKIKRESEASLEVRFLTESHSLKVTDMDRT